MSQAPSTPTRTLGATLERDRLEHRVGRVAVAIAVLRRLGSEHRREPPRHIRQTIAEFEAQLETMNARLRHLTPIPAIEDGAARANARHSESVRSYSR
jgi:hypothetical protein